MVRIADFLILRISKEVFFKYSNFSLTILLIIPDIRYLCQKLRIYCIVQRVNGRSTTALSIFFFLRVLTIMVKLAPVALGNM